MMALIPTERFYNFNWVEYHRNHYCIIKDSKSISLLLGDSIVAGVSRYANAWNQYLAPINALDLGIGGDRVENVLWRAFDLPLQPSVKNLGILSGTNNIPLANGSLDFSLFYKDLLHLIEEGSVNLTKSITLMITHPRYNHINLSSTNSNTSYSGITRQKAQNAISFSLNDHNFPPLSNICQPILSNVTE